MPPPYVHCVATTPIDLTRPEGKGLAAGTLGLWGSTVIGLASTAPVYSLVATLGFVVLAVGAQAPIAFVIAFIPMLFIAFAYRELNNAVPDCGTTFTWGTKAFGPWVGLDGRLGRRGRRHGRARQPRPDRRHLLLGADRRHRRNSEDALLARTYRSSRRPASSSSPLMTWVSWRGVEIGERIQNILLGIQYLALAIFVVAALWQFFAGTAPDPTPFDWAWFNPFAFTDWCGFIEAILLALFIYWGWDTCLALNEETKDPKRIPGPRGAADDRHPARHLRRRHVAAMMYAGLGETGTGLGNEANADDFFLAIKDGLLGPLGWVLVVAVHDLGDLLHADHDPARPPAARSRWRPTRPSRAVRDSAPDGTRRPSFSTLVMGVVASLYYVGMTLDQRQHPAGLDPVARARDRLLLRASPATPASGTSAASCSPRRATSSTRGCSRLLGRAHAHVRLRAVGDRHVRRRLRLYRSCSASAAPS